MVSNIFKAFRGEVDETAALRSSLSVATDSGVIDVHKDIISKVVEKSFHEEDRKVIMSHLRECLTEPSGKKWKRVHAALLLMENLVQDGSPELILEAAEGRHFDVVQRMSLLEHFEYTSDVRAQKMVRAKATAMRSVLVSRIQSAEDTSPSGDAAKDTRSTCSPAVLSMASQSTSCTATNQEKSISNETVGDFVRPQGQMILNGIVAVGHRDDTTSESEGEKKQAPVQFREQRKVVRQTRRERRQNHAYSSESEGSVEEPSSQARTAPKPAAQLDVDLLGL